MADNELLTDFIVPVDLTGVEEWIPGGDYVCGENTFEVSGAQMPKGAKKKLVIVHKIVDGAKENMNRSFNVFFTLDGKQKALGPLKAYMRIIAGDAGFVRGQPAFSNAVIGRRFKANIRARKYKREDGTDATQYEMDMHSIKLLGGQAVAAAPLEPVAPTP